MNKNRLVILGRGILIELKRFMRRLARLPKVLRPRERFSIAVLLMIIAGSFYAGATGSEHSRPAFGGTYTEGFVGQPRFINPILATTDIDRAMSHLIYSGLMKIDDDGNLAPDLAEHFLASDANKQFTFFLREDVLWHDGQKFTAKDVLHTLDLVKQADLNSPYFDSWKDIQVEAPDDRRVIFHLKDSLATFPWMTTLGVIPEGVGSQQLTTSFVGTGPYKYNKVRMRSGAIESIVLIRNSKWYGVHEPYIDTIECWFYRSSDEARVAFTSQKILGVAGVEVKNAVRYDFALKQQTHLLLNSQSAIFKDTASRAKLLKSDAVFDTPQVVQLLLDQSLADEPSVKTILRRWKERNIDVKITQTSLDDIKTTQLAKRAYDAIVVAIGAGPQVDPYAYWYSTQADGAGLNFARLKNNDLDKMLVDQRRSVNAADRDQLLQKIASFIANQNVDLVISTHTTAFWMSNAVHARIPQSGRVPADRFDEVDQWYMKTRR